MKQNDIEDLNTLDSTRLENFFNIYTNTTGEYFYNILNTVNFNTEDMSPMYYDLYTVLPGDTYTFISYKQYGTINLWWLICSFNSIINPITLPESGKVLKILKTKYVSNILSRINSK